jgi:hypothetical protein
MAAGRPGLRPTISGRSVDRLDKHESLVVCQSPSAEVSHGAIALQNEPGVPVFALRDVNDAVSVRTASRDPGV